MNLSDVFIRRPVMTVMLNAAMVVFGIVGLLRLPVRELPDVDPSIVNILTVYPGASAEVVESEVTEPIEEAISSAEHISLISSTSREQVSEIVAEFRQGRDVDLAAQDIRDLVARVRGQLPDDIEEPVVSKQNANAEPIMWIAFFSERYSTEELTRIAEDKVKDRLQTVEGVSSVILGGEKQFAIRLRLAPERMAAAGVTVMDVERALFEKNVELPSGRIENLSREMTVQTEGQLKTARAFNALIIRQEETRTIRLQDVGVAENGVADERTVARFNSKPAIGLGVIRQSGANTLEVAEKIKARMAELAPTLPQGIEFKYPYDQSTYVAKAVHEVWGSLGLAVVLVVLTIFLFLRDVRSTILPTLAIPISVTTTFGILYLMGFSINIFTLLALVLAIGIVVDDAIIVLENIYRHIEEGKPPMEAALEAMKEISFAVVATTLSLVAVFIPVAFIGGVTGRLLLEFVISLAVSVLVSGVVALTLSPMAGARLLRPVATNEHGRVFLYLEERFAAINRRYERTLNWALHHRGTVMLLAAASLLLSVFFFLSLQREFLPEEDKGRLMAFAITPEGSTPEYTDRMVRDMEVITREAPEVDSFFTAVALPFNGPGSGNFGIMFARLTEGPRRHVRDIADPVVGLGARYFNEVEGAIAIPITPKAVDIDWGQAYQLVIRYPELTDLDAYAGELTGKLRMGGFLAPMSIRSTFEMTKPELEVEIDRGRAGDLGVSIRDISRTLQIMLGGQDLSDVTIDGRQYDVIAQLDRVDRLVPETLQRLFVRNDRGELIRLDNLVTTRTTSGPNSIQRFGRERCAIIEASPMVSLGEAVDKTEAILTETLPPGFSFDWKGEARNLRESSSDLWGVIILSALIVYMVLGAQFESFTHPFTIIIALLLALVGAFGLLYVLSLVNMLGQGMHAWAHYTPDAPWYAHLLNKLIPRIPSMTLNIFSQVGILLLFGMATKNAILLVEFANQQMAKGLDAQAAILKAGAIRLRPILMTSLSTIAGILPIAIGFGGSAESRRPLGVVAVGGLLTSTFLTLIVIPVIYVYMDRLQRYFKSSKR